ncbi:LPXTG cell wall anchor domain-containing protein [Enterococcus durans]|uniref:LPXTG cell wall anchor domain-containing protein n=1 Tax=Enterococcus durans TaxID=53345 RepID=UPI003567D8F5
MKTSKKLLHSSLILGLTFGNISGPVVEAVSSLKSVERSTIGSTSKTDSTSTSEKKKEETTSATAKEKSTTNESKKKTEKASTPLLEESILKGDDLTRSLAKPIPDTLSRPTGSDIRLTNWMVNYVAGRITAKFSTEKDNYVVGDTISVDDILSGVSAIGDPTNYSGFPSLSYDVRFLAILKKREAAPATIYYMDVVSESGNWRMRMLPDDAATTGDTEGQINATFTRLKVAPPQQEVFKVSKLPVSFSWWDRDSSDSGLTTVGVQTEFKVNIPLNIGSLTATTKSGTHALEQHVPVPDPKDYVDVGNSRGNVSYQWEVAPDTSKVGSQSVRIRVSDQTGRSATTSFNIKIDTLLTPKAENFDILQYDKVPDPKNYFDVATAKNYTLEWINNPNTLSVGVQTWKARVKTADGREEEAEIKMNVQKNQGLTIKLKPIEDRLIGQTYPTLATSFKNYVESVTMHGREINMNTVQFVPEESIEPKNDVVGRQPVKFTLQMKHPDTDVLIKGSAETSVNVFWGNTILMRTQNGRSAGAFSLNLNKANTSSATIVMRRGLDSPWDEAVNPNGLQFAPYYKFEVLRNGNPIYDQEIINRSTLQEIMNAFGNNNNEITVQMNDIIKITHPEKSAKSSVVMIDEKEHDFTYGSDYAYYRVTQNGLIPAPVVEAESAGKVFVLGEDTRNIDSASLIENATINGEKLDKNQYTVEALGHFDTSTIGFRKMRVRITMKDGIASEEFEINYSVGWGSTFVLKGLDDTTVGAFSLLNQNGQWALQSSQGVNGTNLSGFVNNHFGRETYYSIEVLDGSTRKYNYEVAGNSSIREAINGFNNGQPLIVEKGNVIKVYHAETNGKNLLMEDELVKDFTVGSNYAYYKVTDHGLEAVLNVEADAAPQEFSLGETTKGIDGTKLIKSIKVNGIELANNLYTVTQLEEFDTTSAGSKNLRIKFETTDGMVSKEITVPYEVKWGNTILMRSATGDAAGAFSLRIGETSASSVQIAMTKGLATTGEDAVGPTNDPYGLYYSFEVLRNERSVYEYEVANRFTVNQAIKDFNNGNGSLNIQLNDVIKIYHPEKTTNSSVVMIGEQEKDYTYGTEYAYYKVTPQGFVPVPVMTAEGAKKELLLGEETRTIDANQLVSTVKINGQEIDENLYTVETLSDISTQTVGTRKVKLKVTAKDGLSSDEIEAEYTVKWGDSLVLKGLNNATVGAFSLVEQNKQWLLQSTQGVDGTNLSNPVNNLLGRQVYYRLDVIKGVSSSFTYEVLGNSTIGESIKGFNNGSPLAMAVGDVIKVYHAETNGKNLFMMDEVVKDFTVGSNEAYYEVTEEGLTPILAVSVDSSPQEFTLGDITTNVDGASLVNSVTVNGSPLTSDQYTVKQLGKFDTTTAGKKDLRIQFDTKDGNISKEITVPYEVKWGNTILLKSENGHSAGAFSLHTTNGSGRQLAIHTGLDTPANEQISSDFSLYYSIEVLRDDRIAYNQEIPGSATLQQVMDNFGTNKAISVQFGDVVKIYHPQRTDGSSVLYVNESEEDFTYGSPYAYYEVTAYGFKALPVMEAESANKEFFLGVETTETKLNDLFADVRINGETVDEEAYTIKKLSDFDTSTIGDKTIKIRLEMKDGLADLEMDVPYKVRWGSTVVLKGLEDATVGAFSMINQDDNWSIKATKGEDTTVLENPVNNVFGRDVYYRIEVVENPDAKKVASPLEAIGTLQNGEMTETSTPTRALEPPLVIVNEGMPLAESTDKVKYSYEVTGNMTIGQAIKGFNKGQPLTIDEGDVIKVYHAEPGSRNLLMRDDLVKNFTGGSNYAHYQVSNHEFEPITDIEADTVTQELTLGEDPSEVDPTKLIENVRFNGQKLAENLYTVEQVDAFDTNTAGPKTLNVKVATADGVTARDVSVPYEVKWGSTIQLKNRNGDTVGSFGLLKKKEQMQIQSMQGNDQTTLSNRVTEFDDNEVYYGIEVLNRSGSKHKYEVRGTQTIEQAISRFNSGKPLNVTVGEIIKVYHADSNSNLLMSEEMERNFTYGSNYAYYEVTEYGFEPTGEFIVEPAEAKLVKGTEQVDLKSLLKEVKLNGKDIPKNAYSVTLDPEMEIDTSKLGSQTVKLTVKADRSYGGFSAETEATFEVVEEGQAGQGNGGDGATDGTTAGGAGDATGGATANSSNLPKTNATRNAAFSIFGFVLVAMASFLMFWKKRKKENHSENKKVE